MSNEKIYTIRISEAMDEKCGCPLCAVKKKLEAEELERILGAAMMEPDVRIETNAKGFCSPHLAAMQGMSNKLSLALMLGTHLEALHKKVYKDTAPLFKKIPDPKKQQAALSANAKQCYLCSRINEFMSATELTFAFMYKTVPEFEAKIKEQPYFCLDHQKKLLEAAPRELDKEAYKSFAAAINGVSSAYAEKLVGDLDWFCKKFDYRYKDEDWKDSKDAIDRAIKFLNE